MMLQVFQWGGAIATIWTAMICMWLAHDLHKRTRVLERKLGALLVDKETP